MISTSEKSSIFLDKWFDELGFSDMNRITGVSFHNFEKATSDISRARAVWDSMSLKEKQNHYNAISAE